MTDAEGYAATIAARIAEAEASPDADAPADYLEAATLELHYLVAGSDPWDGYPIREVRAIVTVGGPYAEVIGVTGSDVVQVVVRWWSDAASTTVHAPRIAAELEALGDAYAAEVIR